VKQPSLSKSSNIHHANQAWISRIPINNRVPHSCKHLIPKILIIVQQGILKVLSLNILWRFLKRNRNKFVDQDLQCSFVRLVKLSKDWLLLFRKAALITKIRLQDMLLMSNFLIKILENHLSITQTM
jgi:hypothetical protein